MKSDLLHHGDGIEVVSPQSTTQSTTPTHSSAIKLQGNQNGNDEGIRKQAMSAAIIIRVPQGLAAAVEGGESSDLSTASTTYCFDLKDAHTISDAALDAEIKSTLGDVNEDLSSSSNMRLFRVVKAEVISRKRGLIAASASSAESRESRRVERDRRRGAVGRNRIAAGASSPTSSASSENRASTEKMRCLRCATMDTPQWRYIHKGRYCNACYMRVKRWVENNRPGRKLPSRLKTPVTAEDDARLQRDADDLVAQAFEALEKQGI